MTRFIPLVAIIIACGGGDDSKPVPRTTVSPEAIKLARDACKNYQRMACKCAETHPKLKKHCDDATRNISLLNLQVNSGTLDDGRLNIRLKKSISITTASCFEGTNELLPVCGPPAAATEP